MHGWQGYANSHSALQNELKSEHHNEKTQITARAICVFWSKWRDSNSRPPVPETGALPTALHLEIS